LSSVFSFAAGKLRIVDLGTDGGRHLVDAFTLSPIDGTVSIIAVRTSSDGRRDSWRIRECSKTGSRCLSSVFSFAAGKLRIVDLGTDGDRHLVDAFTLSPITRTISIIAVRTSGDGRRHSGRIGKGLDTGSRFLTGVGALAALELRVVSDTADRNRHFVGTRSIGPP
jgi:hypothetical protein